MSFDISSIVGSVASVINTALPLLMASSESDGTSDGSQPSDSALPSVAIGPATLWRSGTSYYLANIASASSSGDNPLVVCNLTTPVGEEMQNFFVTLEPMDTFDIGEYLPTYTYGECSITGNGGTTQTEEGKLQGVFQAFSRGVLNVGKGINYAISPTVTLQLKLNVGAGGVATIGILCGTALGLAYIFNGENSTGTGGTKSGNLNQDQLQGEDGYAYTMALPDSVDFSDGIYGFSANFTVPLDVAAKSSDPNLKIERVTPEIQRRLKYVSARK